MPPHDAARKEEQERAERLAKRLDDTSHVILLMLDITSHGELTIEQRAIARTSAMMGLTALEYYRKPIPAEQMRKEVDG
jgi:hypothetical protein